MAKQTDETKGKYDIEQIRRDYAILRKYAAIKKADEEVISVQSIYIDITGDWKAALVLDELIHFTLPRDNGKSGLRIWKDGVLWMAVSRAEWWKRKRLTPKQADTAIEHLLEQNLIHKDYFRFKGQFTTHLRLNVKEFFRRYFEELDKANPPEDESDSVHKDIDDLYEMMGIPKQVSPNGDTPLPNGNTASPNGELHNSPHAALTQPLNTGADAPPLPLDWQIASDMPIQQTDETKAERIDAANLIAMTFGANSKAAFDIALAFQNERGITFTESDIKGQRKAIKQLLEKKIRPEHVTAATRKLMDAKLTVSDLFAVFKTAVDLANQAFTTQEYTRLL